MDYFSETESEQLIQSIESRRIKLLNESQSEQTIFDASGSQYEGGVDDESQQQMMIEI